jgi:hypothetical protein
MIILGAGLAGCLAGALERDAEIYEVQTGAHAQHKAVLRFRDDKVSRALGIPFKRVRVNKAVWLEDRSYNWCSPRAANLYSQKVIGRLMARSIGDLAPVDRFIAPDNLHELLAARCEGRIHWGTTITGITREILYTANTFGNVKGVVREGAPIVSTLPLEALHKICSIEVVDQFTSAPIHVERYRVPDSDMYATTYFPAQGLGLYRATLSGELLMLEGMTPIGPKDRDEAVNALGLNYYGIEKIETVSQRYGKIMPLPDDRRKKLLLDFTLKFGVFSLGRFATWRNILLDDVMEDLFKIRAMVHMGTYDIFRVNA